MTTLEFLTKLLDFNKIRFPVSDHEYILRKWKSNFGKAQKLGEKFQLDI